MNSKVVAIFFAFGIHLAAQADVIRCTNASGKLAYTDDPSKCINAAHATTIKTTTEKFDDEVPDLYQMLTAAGFKDGGRNFCGPVAISNSLVWLEGNKSRQYQIDLVKKLASPEYMNTNPRSGTILWNLISGVDKYAKERWKKYKRLEYRGWSSVPEKFRLSAEQPTQSWMQLGLHKKGATWINIGWYKREAQNYERTGGHWVTLVGYEKGRLEIHDPGSAFQSAPQNQFIETNFLSGGLLIDGKYRAPATNHFAVSKGMAIPATADLGIIDGAIVFELE